MYLACPCLRFARELQRRAHFSAHRIGNFLVAAVVQLEHLAQERQALLRLDRANAGKAAFAAATARSTSALLPSAIFV